MRKPIQLLFVEEAYGWRCDAYAYGQVVGVGRGVDRYRAAVAARSEAGVTRQVVEGLKGKRPSDAEVG